MHTRLVLARRLCAALASLLESDPVAADDASLIPRTQAVVNQLTLLAEYPEVREEFREPVRLLLERWQVQMSGRAERLHHLRLRLDQLELSRTRLTGLVSSYGQAPAWCTRLRACA